MQVWNAIGSFFRRLWGITLGQLIKVLAIAAVALILLLFVGLAAASLWPNSKVPLSEPVHEIVYLDQGWGPGRDARERQAYYYTPQGTTIKGLRYSWFVNLERPWGSQRFADPDHMREYGFLVDLKPSAANPILTSLSALKSPLRPELERMTTVLPAALICERASIAPS